MSVRTTIILIVIVLALGGIWMFTTRDGGGTTPPPPAATERGRLFADLEADAIAGVTIERVDGPTLVFERDVDAADGPGDWRLTAPVAAPIESWRVDNLVRTLVGLSARARISPGAGGGVSAASVGLEPPRATVKLRTADGVTHRLAVGDQVALATDTYVRRGDEATILAVDEDLSTLIERDLADYRTKTVLDATRDEIVAITLRHGGTTYELVRQATDAARWQLHQPLAAAANLATIDDLLATLTGLRVVEFEAPDTATTNYGFAEPHLEATVTIEPIVEPPAAEPAGGPAPPAERRSTQLVVGAASDLRATNRYATLADEPTVFTLRSSDVDKLAVDLTALRDPQLVDVAATAINRVTLAVGDETLTVTRSAGNWTGSGAVDEIDTASVRQVTSALTDLRATDFIDAPEALDTYGLAAPRASVTYDAEALAAPVTLLIGDTTSSRRNAYVKIDGRPTVFVVSARLADLLARPLLALRSRDVFRFQPPDLQKLVVRRGIMRVVLERTKGGWELTEPADAPLDPEAVDNLVRDLAGLRAKQVVARNELATYGLEDPALRFELTLDTAEGSTIHTLRVSLPDTATYAASGEGAFVFELEQSVRASLTAALIDPDLIDFAAADVAMIAIQGPGVDYQLARTDEGWEYPEDPYVAVDSEKVQDYLTAIDQLEVDQWLAYHAVDPATFGLSEPVAAVRLELGTEGNRVVRQIQFGPQERGELQRLGVLRPENVVFGLDALRVGDLLLPLDHFLVEPDDEDGS